MEREPPPLPQPGSGRRRYKIKKFLYKWWYRPLFFWFMRSTFWAFLFSAVLYLLTAWSLDSLDCAAQFMIGYQNPFNPPLPLSPCQQALVIALRVVGWLLVPATVGATAGLVSAELMRRYFNQPRPAESQEARPSE
ncbi:hypothetical protein ACFYRY_42110 [Streptomyces sp. NPDC005263]|uniref:hypothetical protein n=1 Tax=Streptomyces sp. NPDC005263 TaxID=3364711 RepID=UPI003687B011